jgi:PAS domain S-box-containing protein
MMADGSRFDAHVTAERFQLLVNSVTDYALYMLDAGGYVATWNPGAERLKGYSAEEIIGRHFSTFFTEEDRAAGLPAKALKAAAEQGRFEAEGWRLRKDGGRLWVNAVLDPIRDDRGKLLGFAKITRDFTAKRANEQALLESERRFRLLINAVTDYAIYMLDPDGNIATWNAGAERFKGYKAEEIIGRPYSTFFSADDQEAGLPQQALETARAEGRFEAEGWRLRKDGTRFWVHAVIDAIRDERGELIGFAKITRDVTERRQAAQELDEARAALFQSQKLQALGELTGGVAHDFNNLMTVIRGSADLLRRPGLSQDKRDRYLQAIIDTADRAATLTSHLLAFSRRQALKPEVADLNLRLDALAEVVGRTLGSRHEVKLDLAAALPLVEVDLAQLETAVLNAVFNARDAMAEGGTVTVSTRHCRRDDGDEVLVEIADTGVGMDEEVVSRAFEPFFTTKPVGQGTGLGLSQIHGFAAQAGGRAEIRSRPGEGTAIRIFLPVTDKPLAEPDEAPVDRMPARGLTILLVEDNAAVREFAGHLLEELGYVVHSAGSAEEAVPQLDDESIELLFSDVVMPGESGLDLARRARALRPDLPVLLATGYSDEVRSTAGATFDVLRKPYDANGLQAAIAAALRRKAP